MAVTPHELATQDVTKTRPSLGGYSPKLLNGILYLDSVSSGKQPAKNTLNSMIKIPTDPA